MSYPDYIDGKPPVITLRKYDGIEWAKTTSIDRRDGKYIIVETMNPDKIIAEIEPSDAPLLDQIFEDAHREYAKQTLINNLAQ